MILTLEVVGAQAEDLGAGSRKVFDSIGGTIGRLPDNDWVFPDPYVSGRHALIRYLNGKFFVEDTSTNGVFINSQDNRLARDQSYQLKSGDTIFIDAYRIQVALEKPAKNQKQQDDPFELLKSHAARDDRANRTVAMSSRGGAQEDRTEAMGRATEEPSVEWIGIDVDVATPTLAPTPQPAKRNAPPPARSLPPTPARETASSRSGAVPALNGELLNSVLKAAGIRGVEPTPELAQTIGAVLRVAVGGLMDVLRGRERMKDDMRVRGTTFKPHDNNPLKFSANVDDAFHNLLVKQNAAYLAPPDAFEDALHDVRDHQAAMIAAMRLTFEAMLAHFDPDRLQDDFDKQMKGSILGVPAKLRYWDLFRDKYGELAKDGDASFRALFAEEFAKAYEQQLTALARNRQK